ncbi:MAG: hypothetical protein FMNOHCHN_03651 [Ignavibacteriaceae bacterium]|nr:hypothetical protein [Ignavibacteriaceae bacterium]
MNLGSIFSGLGNGLKSIAGGVTNFVGGNSSNLFVQGVQNVGHLIQKNISSAGPVAIGSKLADNAAKVVTENATKRDTSFIGDFFGKLKGTLLDQGGALSSDILSSSIGKIRDAIFGKETSAPETQVTTDTKATDEAKTIIIENSDGTAQEYFKILSDLIQKKEPAPIQTEKVIQVDNGNFDKYIPILGIGLGIVGVMALSKGGARGKR